MHACTVLYTVHFCCSGQAQEDTLFARTGLSSTCVLQDRICCIQGEAQKAVAEPISRAMDVPQQVPTDQAHHAVKEGLQLAEGDNATSDALPSSTHALMQAGTTINSKPASESTEAGTDSADGGTSPHLCQPVLTFPFPTYGSTGELSFMSDGSFINVKDALAIGDELDAAQGAADELAMQTVPAELASEPASPVSGWSQQTDKFLDVARQLSEDVAEGQGEVFEKAAVADSAAVEKTTQVCTPAWLEPYNHIHTSPTLCLLTRAG